MDWTVNVYLLTYVRTKRTESGGRKQPNLFHFMRRICTSPNGFQWMNAFIRVSFHGVAGMHAFLCHTDNDSSTVTGEGLIRFFLSSDHELNLWLVSICPADLKISFIWFDWIDLWLIS